jgi:translation initiation factor 1 (eIF-1/SUI1)
MTEKKKTKPTKLEWVGSLISTTEEKPISLKGSDSSNQKNEKRPAQKIKGKVQARKETKGRAGKPVAILFNFTDPEANNEESLKLLCSELKNKLACGGTIENKEIILTLRDFDKLKEVLMKLDITLK